jgi:3,4-dihydroxy 2-butanone 4-phosphate synthase
VSNPKFQRPLNLAYLRSGIICTPLTGRLAMKLFLPQMVAENMDPNRTAYTVSIDSNDPSVSTGISAHDRALTVRTLTHPKTEENHFRRPGHIFPLKSRPGGIRERHGHTEAATEFCRLAGKVEVGAICELVEDGEEVEGIPERAGGGMMRRDACLRFGKKWGLKVCTIEDLVDYVHLEHAQSNGAKK